MPAKIPRTPRRRPDRRSLKTLDPSRDLPNPPHPVPPAGAHVISVQHDPGTQYVVWRFDSIILDVVSNPLAYLAIAGFTMTDWDGFEENALFTYASDEEGNPPGPGDLWTALANEAVQTENGGIVAGAGEMS